jgi:penicillin amidase
MLRWLKRIGIGLAALLTLATLLAAAFLFSFRFSVPGYDGSVRVAALDAKIEIVRDAHAVPHIQAESFRDAAYGLGYAHAQDRLWQMEMARRFVQGRLAELFGASAFGSDALMRTLGLYTAAEDALDHLSPEAREALLAYAEGVNAYISNSKDRWPIEFVLTGNTPPEPWRPADSIAVLKGLAFQLSENAFAEAARMQMIATLGRQSTEDFFPPFSAAPLPAYLDTLYGGTRTGAIFPVPDTTASDNWVVDGAHSITGKPLLANDPHLGFDIPSVWYLAHLSYPDDDLVGGTLPGIPAIVAGHNRHVAWGMTNTGPDTQDLYLERINSENRQQYQVPGMLWANFDVRLETVKVRFGEERRVLVRSTRHGSVVSDVAGTSFARAAPQGYALALDWTALQPDDTSYEALLGINRRTSFTPTIPARAAISA